MNKLINEEQNKELLKLVKEYPTLPLVFFCNSEDICDDYNYTFMKFRRVEKGVIYESDINDAIYTSEDDYVEDLCDYFADDIRYSNMTDVEYEKEMQKEAIDKATNDIQEIIDDTKNKTVLSLGQFIPKLEIIQDELNSSNDILKEVSE